MIDVDVMATHPFQEQSGFLHRAFPELLGVWPYREAKRQPD